MESINECDMHLLGTRIKNLTDGLKSMNCVGAVMVNKKMLTACHDYMVELYDLLRRPSPEITVLTCEGCYYQSLEGASCCSRCKRLAPDCFEPEPEDLHHDK